MPYSLCFYQNLAYSRCSNVKWIKCHQFQIRNNGYFDVVFSFSFYPLLARHLSGCNSHFLLGISYKDKYWIPLPPFFFLPFFLCSFPPFLPLIFPPRSSSSWFIIIVPEVENLCVISQFLSWIIGLYHVFIACQHVCVNLCLLSLLLFIGTSEYNFKIVFFFLSFPR